MSLKSRQSSLKMNLKSSLQVLVAYALVFFLLDLSMLTLVFATLRCTGAAQSASHAHNVLASKATWRMKSVKRIKRNNALIVSAKSVAFLIVSPRFANLVEAAYEENRRSVVPVSASSVHPRQSYVRRVENVYLIRHGAMAFKIAPTTRKTA